MPTIAAIPEKSVAVLPFENLSHDPDNAYFADGIQEEILTRLAKVADLKVISRAHQRSNTRANRAISPKSRSNSASPTFWRAACKKRPIESGSMFS
jgi:TolB-like protein